MKSRDFPWVRHKCPSFERQSWFSQRRRRGELTTLDTTFTETPSRQLVFWSHGSTGAFITGRSLDRGGSSFLAVLRYFPDKSPGLTRSDDRWTHGRCMSRYTAGSIHRRCTQVHGPTIADTD